MEKNEITTYTAIGADFTKDTEKYGDVLLMLSAAIGFDDERAAKIMEKCQKGKKRLIFYYPPSDIDTTGWELIGEIEDGCLYLG